MYPGTKIQLIDNSTVTPVIANVASTTKPLYAVFFTSPRGPERFTMLEGSTWAQTYLSNNTPDFYKDGQPLLQAAMNANSGARLFSKRIVADDATLASTTYAIAVNTTNITKTVYTKVDGPDGALEVIADDGSVVGQQIKLADAQAGITDGTVLEVGNYVKGEEVTTNNIHIRPVSYSFKNKESFNAAYIGPKATNKENLYSVAKKDIENSVMSDDSYVDDEDNAIIEISSDGQPASKFDLFSKGGSTMTKGKIYPLFTIFDSGRGSSDKSIRLVPNYSIAKAIGKMIYTLQVLDKNNNNALIEAWTISVDPNAKDSKLRSLDAQTVISGNSYLIDAVCHFEAFDTLMEDLSKLGVQSDIFTSYDMIGRRTLGGKSFTLSQVSSAEDGLAYNVVTTNTLENFVYTNQVVADSATAKCTIVPLVNGESGSISHMNDAASKDAFYKSLHEVLTGVFSKDIYNLDLYTFDCIFDANYDNDTVKRDIQRLCAYRGDCVAFMDMGTYITSLEDVKDTMSWDGAEAESKPAGVKYFYYKDQNVYVTSMYYDIKNPFNGRQITVTATYSLSNRMVNHFINGRERAFAGQTMGITIPEAIEGTVNFIPKIYPLEGFTIEELNMTYPSDSESIINEKQELCDIKVNYGTYYNGVLTMDTLFTTYPKDSELSYINNVMGAQLIIKEIRKTCPATTRYNFIDADSLSKYQEEIQDRVIDRYAGLFNHLSFQYIKDATYEENKIFYGAIKIGFKPFTQSEFFKVTAINAAAEE